MLHNIAYFVQGLKKAQTALVLRGEQGAGKGIFFNEVIKPLISQQYTKEINDKSLNTQYKGGLVEDILFFNLDEISVQKAKNASNKNFLKALVTNDTITAEKKYKTMKGETKIYGQVLITSNEPEVLEIEPSDRRYTVYNTAGNLKHTNFLGYGSYEALSEAIEGELESFICYLKCYKVYEQAANTAQMTPEKQELIDIYIQKQEQGKMKRQPKLTKQQTNIQEFGLAVSNRNHSYFLNMQFDAPNLYNEVMSDLYNGIFKVSNLLAVYKVMYGSGSFKTTAELLRALQEYYFYQFTTNQIRIFCVDDEQVEYLILLNPNSYSMY